MNHLLTIAGSDPSCGAGIQADLKVFHAFGAYGLSVVSSITAQNSQGVLGTLPVPAPMIRQQLEGLLADMRVDAVKTGMLHDAETVEAVASVLRKHPPMPLIIDPVTRASDGTQLLSPDGLQALQEELIPICLLVTPNLAETETLTGVRVESLDDMAVAAVKLLEMGAHSVLIKGGHLQGDPVDRCFDGRSVRDFAAPRIPGEPVHGTGCMLSAAIAARIAAGDLIQDAVAAAHEFIRAMIRGAVNIGRGARLAVIPPQNGYTPAATDRAQGVTR